MVALIILVSLALAAFIGGFIAVFAGRRYYALWMGLATFFFITRVLDLALYRTSDFVRNLGGLLVAILVVVSVVVLRDRIIRFVPPFGGFLVSATIAERILGIVFPDAGKFMFFAVLIAGGVIGFFIFLKFLDFDNAIIVLSALWGASFLSTSIFDFLDILFISFAGLQEQVFSGFLNGTQFLQTLFWLGLALIGIFVQRRQHYKPIPVLEKEASNKKSKITLTENRKRWIIGGVIGALLIVFILALIAGGDNQFSKSIHTKLISFQRSLGMEAEAPGDAPWEWGISLLRPQIELEADDRILVMVPHPDDDILSTAGLLQQALEKGLPVKVVFFTNGDYNETSFALYRKELTLSSTQALRLGETRREEALDAQGILGVTPEQIVFLGYPDGGGLDIFEKHWADSQPYRGLLSGQTAVPYTFAQSVSTPYKGESIVADLKKILIDFKPTKIFTSHPGDVHPDHQSLPLYLKIAMWDLERELNPDVYHFITHYGRWPQPRGYQPEHPLDPPAQFDVGNRWYILPITAEQRDNKLAALQAHKTQWGSGQPYLESVVRANELFDVINEISLPQGEEVEILPAETAFQGQVLALHPESEQAAFTEAEVRSVTFDGDELIFAVQLEEPLVGDIHAKVWTMGYREDTPFENMPKIYMDLSSSGYKIFNQVQELAADSVTVSSTPNRSEVRIPLSLLGDPERILISAQTNNGDVPLDNIPWVFLNLIANQNEG